MDLVSRLARLSLLGLLAAGCSGNVTNDDAGVCDRPDRPAACDQSCSLDTDCPAGFHCGAQGRCTAQCTLGGSGCGAGQTCDAQGRCVALRDGGLGDWPGGRGDLLDCPDVTVKLEAQIPDVLLLIDQSGSMEESFGQIDGNSVDRWQAVRYALTDPALGAVSQLQQSVRFGALLYFSRGGDSGGTCPLLTRSPGTPPGQPQLQNRDAIAQLLEENDPERDTPTAESVDAAAADMQAWMNDPDAEPGPKVLLLATDGDPDNCQDADAHNETSRQLSETAVQQAHAAGILTYVLSVGSDVSESHLQRLANAGVGKPLDPPDAPFYRGNNPQELVAAFHTIIGGVRSCTLTLDGQVDPQYEQSGAVRLNGQLLAQDEDWQLVDASTIELLGQACQDLLAASSVQLEASFPCGAIIE